MFVIVLNCAPRILFVSLYVVTEVTRCKVRNFLRHNKIFSQLFTTKNRKMSITVIRTETIGERIQQLVNAIADGKNTIFAAKLGINEANVRSYIRGTLPKADILEKIVITYEVNAHWLLTGYGQMFEPNEQPAPNPFVLTADTQFVPFITEHLRLLDKKDEKITQQAYEIGRLEERVKELERQLQKNAGDVSTGDTANVG